MTPSVWHYFQQFYAWSNIVPALAYAALAFGLATTIAAVLAVVTLAQWAFVHSARRTFREVAGELLAPVALIVTPMLFFLPNPLPPRHFLLTLAGAGILVGWVADRIVREGGSIWLRARLKQFALVTVALLVVANQVLAEAVRPTLLRINDAHSPYVPLAEDYRTMTHANVGYSWQRHAALDRRRRARDAFVTGLVNSCDDDIVIISDEPPQILTRLFAGGTAVSLQPLPVMPVGGTDAVFGGRHFVVLEETYLWPDDPVRFALSEQSFAGMKIVLDPTLTSVHSKMQIPADRAVRPNCFGPGAGKGF